jgi:hypothetical protein
MVFRVWDKDFGPGSDDFLGKVTVGADVLKELKVNIIIIFLQFTWVRSCA